MNKLNNPLASLRQPSAMTKEEFLRSASTNVAITEATVSDVKESNVIDLDSLLNEVNSSSEKKETLKPETTLLNSDQKKKLEIASKKAGLTKSKLLAVALEEYFEKHVLGR